MGSKQRSQQHLFWQHPVAIVVSFFLVAVVGACVFLATQPPPIANADQMNADAQRSASAAQTALMQSFAATSRAHRAVFMGDSFTAGSGASTPANRYTSRIAKAEGWTEVNVGASGAGYANPANATVAQKCGLPSCPGYTDEIAAAVKADPSIVVVSGGRNDAHFQMSQITPAVTAFFADLRTELPNAQLLVVSPIWDNTKPPGRLGQLGVAVKEATAAAGGRYCDIGLPLLGKPELMFGDAVHPNDQGHQAIAVAVEAAMKQGCSIG